MKRLNAFVVLILAILLCVVLLIVQNNVQIGVNFMFWKFNTTLGLFSIILFFSGLVAMWIITLFTHYRDVSKLKKELAEKDQKMKEAERQLEDLQKTVETQDQKINELEAQKEIVQKSAEMQNNSGLNS